MDTTTIIEPSDRSFPFSRTLFEDRHIVYHGTWSAYAQTIESKGFGGFALPFDHKDVETIMHAWEQVGFPDTYAKTVFFASRPGGPRMELSLTGNFWHARAYATDGGGEVVRMVVKDAKDFEALCSEDAKRLDLKAHWEKGLKECPNHARTLKAVEFLGDKGALQATCRKVTKARQTIEGVVQGGFPVVYDISSEPQWFGNTWERYLARWEEGHRAAVELRCSRDLVSPDRIIAKVLYPNGTDRDFMPTWIQTWAEAEALLKGN
jgi:hypothetical protein